MAGLVIIGVLVLTAIFAPWIASGDGTRQVLSEGAGHGSTRCRAAWDSASWWR